MPHTHHTTDSSAQLQKGVCAHACACAVGGQSTHVQLQDRPLKVALSGYLTVRHACMQSSGLQQPSPCLHPSARLSLFLPSPDCTYRIGPPPPCTPLTCILWRHHGHHTRTNLAQHGTRHQLHLRGRGGEKEEGQQSRRKRKGVSMDTHTHRCEEG